MFRRIIFPFAAISRNLSLSLSSENINADKTMENEHPKAAEPALEYARKTSAGEPHSTPSLPVPDGYVSLDEFFDRLEQKINGHFDRP